MTNDERGFRLVTVFDTNAYVRVGLGELEEVVAQEAKNGVWAFASVWPCLELLARCVSPDPLKRRRAWSALGKIVLHAGYRTPAGPRLRVLEAGELSLARGLFGHTPEEPLLDIGFVGNLVVAAATMSLDDLTQQHSAELAQIAERVRLEEQHFTNMAATGSARVGRPRPTESAPTRSELQIIAAGLVEVLAKRYNITLTRENARRGVSLVVENFPVALAFLYRLMAESSPSSGLPGGANSVWDVKIAFHAARGSGVSRAPALLVSDDKRLHRAASEAREARRVVRFDDYRVLLADPGALEERATALPTLVDEHEGEADARRAR